MSKKKRMLYIVLLVWTLNAAGCGKQVKMMDGAQALQLLQEQVIFSTKLSQKDGGVSFPDLPTGSAAVRLTGSGYYADELVLITLESERELPMARQAIETHLAELKAQFINVFPIELDKIENAVIYEMGHEIILCITDDYPKVRPILENSVPNTAADSSRCEGKEKSPALEAMPVHGMREKDR